MLTECTIISSIPISYGWSGGCPEVVYSREYAAGTENLILRKCDLLSCQAWWNGYVNLVSLWEILLSSKLIDDEAISLKYNANWKIKYCANLVIRYTSVS